MCPANTCEFITIHWRIGILLLIIAHSQQVHTGIDRLVSPPINRLSADPVGLIKDFLEYSEQARLRLINRGFNRQIKESHYIIQDALRRVYIAQQYVYGNSSTAYQRWNASVQLEALHAAYQFDEVFCMEKSQCPYPKCADTNIRYIYGIGLMVCTLRSFQTHSISKTNRLISWKTKVLKDCLEGTNYRFRFSKTMESAYKYQHSLIVKIKDPVIKLLVYSSRMLIHSLITEPIESLTDYDAFSAFIYQSTWCYLSSPNRNRSVRLPPFWSISGLHLNRDLLGQQTDFLLRIQNESRFMVWCPHRIRKYAHFKADCVCFYIHKFMHSM